MALKATVCKATLQIADIDRGVYADHQLTLARHPSESDERMMIRLLAFALNVPADSRDGGRDERMGKVNEEDGVWGCTAIGYCSVVCPKQVDPAHAINMYKIESTMDYFRRFMAPRGARK